MYKIAARNLWLRKSRSLLAVLALVVGVLAIVLLISLTGGMKASVTELLGSVGGVYVMEKGAQDQIFSQVDASYGKEFERIPGVKVAIPEVWGMITRIDGRRAEGGDGLTMGMVMALGLDPFKEQRRGGMPYGVSLLRGRSIRPGETGVAIVGEAIAENHRKAIGSKIRLNNKLDLTVIGVFGKDDLTDSVVAMHIDDARELSGMSHDKVNDFVVMWNDPESEERIARTIEFKYPDKFDVWTAAAMTEMMDEMMGVIDQFFWIIAIIALLIAGIGIINTMLIAVKERTKEFGVLRAMGWTKDDVLRLVVLESIMLGTAGGVLGVVLGYAITFVLSAYLPFRLVVSPELAASAFAFSAMAGLVGGIYPAWKASSIDPIKAMRGEAL